MKAAVPRIELWCDSFHEGTWAAEGILRQWPSARVSRRHRLGFIPKYSIANAGFQLELEVFGGYGTWTNLPTKIRELLDWGKPDIVGYDRATDKVLFAVEETAAVPTGNQALQRCERMHGAGTLKVPFWYLLGQFGTHVDEGVRQASPWPALMAMALTATFRTPSVVLLYSSAAAPEDYSAGLGMAQLFGTLAHISENFAMSRPLLASLDADLTEQFGGMLKFVGETYQNVTGFLPHADFLGGKGAAGQLAAIASGSDGGATAFPLLDWPQFRDLPRAFKEAQSVGTFLKRDPFLAKLEASKAIGAGYTLSQNAGSRPQPEEDLDGWIKQQKRIHDGSAALQPRVAFRLRLDDFPESQSELRHVTTAKNILYLIDSTKLVFESLERSFDRLVGKFRGCDGSRAALVYVSNSVKPGRIFGDPYTGQFAAFSWVFGGTAEAPRVRFAYFPNHSHGVLQPSRTSRNKGQLIFLSRADYLIFHSGAVYVTKIKTWL